MIKILIVKSGLGFYAGDEFSLETSKGKKLIDLGIAKQIQYVKAPQTDLIELETEADINTQIDNKKPTKRTKKTLK
jgi:hypothetical protein